MQYSTHSPPQGKTFVSELLTAINGEYSAITCYEHLAQLAPNKEEYQQILEIRQDEIKHYHMFTHMYTQLTGQHPTPQLTETCPTEYISGLEYALKDEQKTTDFYLGLADQAPDPLIRQQLLRTASDEQNHAVWFLYYFTKHKA